MVFPDSGLLYVIFRSPEDATGPVVWRLGAYGSPVGSGLLMVSMFLPWSRKSPSKYRALNA